MQAISDAAIVGARWIIALDPDFSRRLIAGEEPSRCGVAKDDGAARYFAAHPEWLDMKPAGQLAILQDVDSGALLSGGVLDMIAVKHTPVRPVPDSHAATRACRGQRWP